MKKHYDVLVVGAGASGIGVGILLKQMGCESFRLIDRGKIGESFRRWPKEMRFITPSFPSQGFGQTDLNAVAPKTSPGYTLNQEHPTGEDYAEYLELLVNHYELPVTTDLEVKEVTKLESGLFELTTSKGTITSTFIIWAAGEYQYPDWDVFPGAELCIHNSQIQSWGEMEDDDYIIIGGYESGLDAVYQLNQYHKKSRLLARTSTWKLDSSDPSTILSPYTFNRIRESLPDRRIKIFEHHTVQSVSRKNDIYFVQTSEGEEFTTSTPPILATGFKGSTSIISHLFDSGSHGEPLVNNQDESTQCEGLFLCGPELRHDSHVFCFIYKFRQRFPVVAEAIGSQLNLDLDILDLYKKESFYLDDLTDCGERCEC
ncbi:NAD(P)-binding domain-containing protein [Halobacillus salinarum]|uniref:NAD(P)-binding domain-containing protein n=1 Tax=Halobacillus salinarum TaxID=2932257 RepID=A0ABY4EJG0_9BACI|nr:NAD(P)/FAD-dependent oxidoreductase [Halobacillus salinarum]UOQ44299.1 NAD(P)-binding domain-containing protein [Halobacillus salinarum]